VILFPSAKINLGLNIINKRHDGFHEIETCMVPIPLYDVLEVKVQNKFQFIQTGIKFNNHQEDNLCVKAYNLLKKDYEIDPVYIHLHKKIPVGAGLGGGSSDSAFTLKALNDLLELKISDEELKSLSEKLGSDCPFFIDSTPKYCVGRGEIMQSLNIDLSNLYLKVIYPGIHISTQKAYSLVENYASLQYFLDIDTSSVSEWKNQFKNSFEEPLFKAYPELKKIKGTLYDEGAKYASMSGSGSTIFGLFEKKPDYSNNLPVSYFQLIEKL
tara:strand:+ start:538 stop:1347 length:810 start_codon:yes stop_codon:yes gene_type:complete